MTTLMHQRCLLAYRVRGVRAADVDRVVERMAPLFGHDLADQPAVVTRQLAAMRGYDATPRLGQLATLPTLPTLVVSGALDRIARPAFGRALAAGIPGAGYVELPDAAHGVPIYAPEQINRLLEQHLAAVRA